MLLWLAACTAADTDDTDLADTDVVDTDVPIDPEALATAEALWPDLADHASWGRPGSWSLGPALSASHPGYIVRYDNQILLDWDRVGRPPEGAISVLGEFSSETGVTLTGVAAMKQVRGYDNFRGDWFWAHYSPDGTVTAAGRLDGCAICHRKSDADYLYPDPPEGM